MADTEEGGGDKLLMRVRETVCHVSYLILDRKLGDMAYTVTPDYITYLTCRFMRILPSSLIFEW